MIKKQNEGDILVSYLTQMLWGTESLGTTYGQIRKGEGGFEATFVVNKTHFCQSQD